MDPSISFLFFSFYFIFHVESGENLDPSIKDYAYESKKSPEDSMKLNYNEHNKFSTSFEHDFNPVEKFSASDFPGLQGESSEEDNNLFLSSNTHQEAAVNILPAIKESDNEIFSTTVTDLEIFTDSFDTRKNSTTSLFESSVYKNSSHFKRTTPAVPYVNNEDFLTNFTNLTFTNGSINESFVLKEEIDKNGSINYENLIPNEFSNSKHFLDTNVSVYKKEKSLPLNLDMNSTFNLNKAEHELYFNVYNSTNFTIQNDLQNSFNESEQLMKYSDLETYVFDKNLTSVIPSFVDVIKKKSVLSEFVNTNDSLDKHNQKINTTDETNATVVNSSSNDAFQNEILTSTYNPQTETKPMQTISSNLNDVFKFDFVTEENNLNLTNENIDNSTSYFKNISLPNERLKSRTDNVTAISLDWLISFNKTQNESTEETMRTSDFMPYMVSTIMMETPPNSFLDDISKANENDSKMLIFSPVNMTVSFSDQLVNASNDSSLRENKMNESLIKFTSTYNDLEESNRTQSDEELLNASTDTGEIIDSLKIYTSTPLTLVNFSENLINDENNTEEIPYDSPEFQNAPYEALLLEDSSENSIIFDGINVTSAIMNKVSVICDPYEQFSNICEHFDIIKSNISEKYFIGSLVLKNPLILPVRSLYQVKLTATDGTSNSSTTVTVFVSSHLEKALETLNTLRKNASNVDHLLDTNHRFPIFNFENISIIIPENFPPGAVISNFHLNISNNNWDDNLTFNLTTLDPSGQFMIEPSVINKNTSLSIHLHEKASLDFEKPEQREFVFLVAAIDQVTEFTLSPMVAVNIEISDVNDNVPEFSEEIYNVTISEAAPIGSVLLYINATDDDSGVYGTEGIRYAIEGKHAKKFRIDAESGTLIVAPCLENNNNGNCLDYEEESHLSLNVKATDDKGFGTSSSALLIITLLDSNDNPPKFEYSEYNASIKLKAKELISPLFVKAVDADISSVIEYSVVSNEIEDFYVNSSTGQILVNESSWIQKNDTTNSRISLLIRAQDEGDNFDVATVIITVIDENNHAPEFLFSYYNSTIPDSSPSGTIVTKVTAIDGDSEMNSKLKYHIQYGGYKNFIIDELTGIVSVAPMAHLEFENQQEYHLHIIASDNGSPMKTGSTHLLVTITDGNNKPPVIKPLIQTVYIKEDIPQGEIIHVIHADDPDASSDNALQYIIQKPIDIYDKNGVMINSSYLEEMFDLDPANGEVHVVSTISRAKASILSMVVLAIDTSSNPLQTGSATLIVNILDGEKFHPIFPSPWSESEPYLHMKIIEEKPVGTFLLSLLASDSKSMQQTFHLIPDNPYVKVNLTTGIVSVKSRIDYEQIQSFSFTVKTLTDNQTNMSSEAIISVDVLNINDNDPVFSQPNYHFTVEENTPLGTFVGNITIKDDDLGDFGKIKLSLDGNHSSYFTISEEGELSLSFDEILDRESIDHLSLKVLAVDQDPDVNKRRSSVASVSITVTDVNDNAPKFTHKYIEEVISPNMPLGSPLVQVTATDKDLGLNSSLKYSISQGNDEGVFWINETSGVIYLKNIPSRNTSNYVLRVICFDQDGEGPFKDESIVNLTVARMNFYAPVFTFPTAHQSDFFVEENVPGTVLLMIVKAEDLDSNHIKYSFFKNGTYVEKLDNFELNTDTGELLIQGPLDREFTEKYMLFIVAKDDGHPKPMEAIRLINVFVIDVDDNVPIFPDDPFSRPYSFSINENEPTKSLVGQVKAFDPDTGENGQIFYYITGGNEEEAFIIDSDSGIIRTNNILDYEEKSAYTLQVKASNKNHLPTKYRERRRLNLNSYSNESNSDGNLTSTSVQIKINNVDDNVPLFVGLPYQTGVQYSAKRGEFVTQVKAIDPDGNNVTYSLLSSHLYRSKASTTAGAVIPQPFTIDQSGRIYTAGLLSSYNQDHFLLTVVAKENLPPHHESKAVVEIWIYELSELVRIVIALPPAEVTKNLPSFIETLSNLTKGNVYVDDVRYHVTKQKEIDSEGTDMYIHVVDSDSHIILPASTVINMADSVAFLLPEYQHLRLTSIEPVITPLKEEPFNPALAALIAVLVVVFIGLIIIIFICCANNYWIDYKKVVSVNDQPLSTISVPSQLLSTYNPSFSSYRENPLWIEHRKVKSPYEEQELSMHVFSDLMNRSQGRNGTRSKNAGYAQTYLEQNSKPSSTIEANLNLDDDYATLDESNSVDNDYIKKQPTSHTGVKTSNSLSKDVGTSGIILTANNSHPQLSINKNGEPVMIGELL